MTDFARLVMASDTTGLRDARGELSRLTRAGDQTERSVTRATNRMDSQFRAVAVSAAKMAAGLVASLGIGRFLGNAIRDTEDFERITLRMQAVIRATGGVAGKTSDELRTQADELARATLASEKGILEAQSQLLTFRNIQGDVFDDAVKAALDLSEAMGIGLPAATLQVAKALELPSQGLTALTRSGTVFTEQQKEQVKAMEAAGNVAGAQRLILEELEKQYGGTAEAAAGGLGGALDSLGQSTQQMGMALVSALGITVGFEAGVEGLTVVMDLLKDNMEFVRIGALGAAAVITGMYLPAIVSATVATAAWVASLITLRGALIATGIGALIVGVGTLIDFIIRLRTATGSWGEALSALGDLAAGVWEGIKTSASSIVPALGAVWQNVQASFFILMENLSAKWRDFLRMIAGFAAEIPGGDFISDRLLGAAAEADARVTGFMRSANDAEAAAARLRGEAASLATQGFDKAREALARLNEIMKGGNDTTTEAADEAAKLAAALEEIGGSGGGGGKAAKAADGLKEAEKAAKELAAQSERTSDSFARLFVGILDGSQKASDALRQMGINLLQSGLSGLFQSSGIFSSGGLFGSIGGLFAGAFDSGGRIGAGQFGIVGERGPEIVTGPANVTSRADTARMMNGNTQIEFKVVNNRSGNEVTQRRERGPDGRTVLIAEINEAATTGQLDRGLGSRFGAQPQKARR